jgi:hypothetical protein
MAVQAMLQAVFSHFGNRMYRLGPDVSTGFCGLHYLRHFGFKVVSRTAKTERSTMVNSTDSTFDARREKAIAFLEKSGIHKSNYLPPATALLWKWGVKVPPPHFASFASTATVTGIYFGLVWGAMMWLGVWSFQGMSIRAALFGAVSAGVMFGVSMAAYYAYGRKKHQFPTWQSLANENVTA